MKTMTISGAAAILLLCSAPALAQGSAVFRCGNEYTNDATYAQKQGCRKLSEDESNVTIIRSTTPAAPPAASNGATSGGRSPSSSGSSVSQQQRDAEKRDILQGELNSAQKRLDELNAEYNNGVPVKMGPEHKNHQKYLDRVEQLKTDIERTESDIQGIRREINRLPPPASNP